MRLLIFVLLFVFSIASFAQEVVEAIAQPSGMEQTLIDLALNWLKGHQWFAAVLMVQSIGRNIFKPLHALIDAYVKSTPSTKDDDTWASFLKSKFYWVLDYIFSLKLGTQSTK